MKNKRSIIKIIVMMAVICCLLGINYGYWSEQLTVNAKASLLVQLSVVDLVTTETVTKEIKPIENVIKEENDDIGKELLLDKTKEIEDNDTEKDIEKGIEKGIEKDIEREIDKEENNDDENNEINDDIKVDKDNEKSESNNNVEEETTEDELAEEETTKEELTENESTEEVIGELIEEDIIIIDGVDY